MENERAKFTFLLRELWNSIEARRKTQLFFLIFLMLIAALVEVLSLGAVMPFLAVLISPEEAFQQPTVFFIANKFGLNSADELILPFTLVFMSAALLAGMLRIFILWATTLLSVLNGTDLSTKVYRNTLNQPYEIHVQRNSSEVISGISAKINDVVFRILQSFLILISSFLVIISIVLVLVLIDPFIALSSFGIFGGTYLVISRIFVKRLAMNSKRIADEQTQVVKALQEGLGGIRDVILNGTQDFYTEIYRRADYPLRYALGNNNFLGQSPRFAIESLAIILISGMAFFLTSSTEGIGKYVPLLGAFVLGAQRLLPNLQQSYACWANIIGSKSSLVDVIKLLDQPGKITKKEEKKEPIIFKENIKLVDVSFQYLKEDPYILENINLKIEKNSRIGFVGSTGSGKSTLFDIIMGLLIPNSGEFLVDQKILLPDEIRLWQKSISHVPQNIFLSDSTIAENIAFGLDPVEVDMDRVRKSAEVACISSFIESSPEGYGSVVGERGVKISGGERQRIGIARALYNKSELLVLDEATSSLDNKTESEVIRGIIEMEFRPTILMIAHRLSTVESCDSIVQLEKGKIVAQGTYKELSKNSKTFQGLANVIINKDN